ncbi:MAG: hypothetical protein PUA52_03685 [Lachnospiraceae bacterium]|nr:hypothetical protein [Lachnospiraceae bacterium]
MFNRKILPVLAVLIAASLTMTAGCGRRAAESDISEASSISIVQQPLSPEEEAAETPKEAYIDPNMPSVEDYKVTEETKSEGLNIVPGTHLDLSDSVIAGEIGKTYDITGAGAALSLTMENIAEAAPEQMTSGQEAEKVVRITYTYRNVKGIDSLMVGQYSFKALDENGNALQIYYFNPENDDEVNMMPVSEGNSYTAALGFIMDPASTKVTIVYDDNALSSGTQIAWTAELP